jgi:hypothetical protein
MVKLYISFIYWEDWNVKNKNFGWICLIVQIVLPIGLLAIDEVIPDNMRSAIFIVASVLSVLMWHEAIRFAMKESIKNGLLVSAFFLVPYALFSISILSMKNDMNSIGIEIVPWMILTKTFMISSADEQMKSTGFEPLVIFALMLIVNIIIYNFRKIQRNKQQTDLKVELKSV